MNYEWRETHEDKRAVPFQNRCNRGTEPAPPGRVDSGANRSSRPTWAGTLAILLMWRQGRRKRTGRRTRRTRRRRRWWWGRCEGRAWPGNTGRLSGSRTSTFPPLSPSEMWRGWGCSDCTCRLVPVQLQSDGYWKNHARILKESGKNPQESPERRKGLRWIECFLV